jgi:uncharacterized membrane protein YGL010W
MKSAEQWFNEYGESHQNPTNELIHWICIPLILFSTLGATWAMSAPSFIEFGLPYYINAGTIITFLGFIWYLTVSPKLSIGMVLEIGAMLFLINVLYLNGIPLLQLSGIIFVGAWIGQFIGHKIEGKKPSFFKDLQFLLIGPFWLMSKIYDKLKIGY